MKNSYSASETNFELPKLISSFSKNVIAYVCGYVVRKVWIRIKCETCRRALMCCDIESGLKNGIETNFLDDAAEYLSYKNALKLILTKSRSNLILPSLGVYTLALATEKLFRRAINCNRGSSSN